MNPQSGPVYNRYETLRYIKEVKEGFDRSMINRFLDYHTPSQAKIRKYSVSIPIKFSLRDKVHLKPNQKVRVAVFGRPMDNVFMSLRRGEMAKYLSLAWRIPLEDAIRRYNSRCKVETQVFDLPTETGRPYAEVVNYIEGPVGPFDEHRAMAELEIIYYSELTLRPSECSFLIHMRKERLISLFDIRDAVDDEAEHYRISTESQRMLTYMNAKIEGGYDGKVI